MTNEEYNDINAQYEAFEEILEDSDLAKEALIMKIGINKWHQFVQQIRLSLNNAGHAYELFTND